VYGDMAQLSEGDYGPVKFMNDKESTIVGTVLLINCTINRL
jgi:hypothetical protein